MPNRIGKTKPWPAPQQSPATITWVVPFTPGGQADTAARVLQKVFSEKIGQQVIIDNRPGAGGIIGAEFVMNAKPDGYTIFYGSSGPMGILPKLHKKISYDPVKNFEPIAAVAVSPLVLLIPPGKPYKTFKEFVDYARKNPDKLIFSSSGLYGALHLPTALFMQAADVKLKHLPTAGGGPALTAILGNNSQVLVTSIAAANAQMKAGKLRALACFSSQRAASTPDVPTLKELGYNVEFSIWVGLFAPKGTPEPVIAKVRAETRNAAANEQFKKAVANVGDVVAYLDQPEFRAFWDSDAKRVEDAVRQIGKVEG